MPKPASESLLLSLRFGEILEQVVFSVQVQKLVSYAPVRTSVQNLALGRYQRGPLVTLSLDCALSEQHYNYRLWYLTQTRLERLTRFVVSTEQWVLQ